MKVQNVYKAKELFEQQNYARHNLLAQLRINWAHKYPDIHGETLILLENQKNYFAEVNDPEVPQQEIWDIIAETFPSIEESFFALKSRQESFFLPTGEQINFNCRNYSLQAQQILPLKERLRLFLEKKLKLANPFGIFIPVICSREKDLYFLDGAIGELQ